MDKRPHSKPYLHAMLAGFGAISLSILFFFLIYRFKGFGDAVSTLISILMPFVYGSVIAYALKPVCNSVDRFLRQALPEKLHRLVNPLAVAASILFGLLLVYALLMMIIPQVISSIITLSATMQSKVEQFIDWATGLDILAENQFLLNYVERIYETISANLNDWLRNTLMPSMQNIVSGVGMSVWNVVIGLKNLLIGLVVAVYLLASRQRFSRQAKLLLYSTVKPHWAKLVLDEISYADKMFGGFINGKILDSAIIGVLCYIVCIIVKFPNALLVSAIVGVTNIIPFFGPFIGAVPATLLILIEDPIKAIWFVLFVLILQQVDGNIIGPKILGSSTGLSSFWVLFAILLFGGLWGFVGMIIGVPLFAVIYDVIKKLVVHGLRHNGCGEMMLAYHQEFGDSNAPHPTCDPTLAEEMDDAEDAAKQAVPETTSGEESK